MNNDPPNRSNQALQPVGRGQSSPAVAGGPKPGALLERLRAAAGKRPEPMAAPPIPPEPVAAPPMLTATAPRMEKVRAPMTCSATGRPFTGILERRGDVLVLFDHELPQPGSGPGSAPEKLSGQYRLDKTPEWACPHCRSRERFWSCVDCRQQPDALHCGGSQGRLRYCACNRLEERDFVLQDTVAVRGQSIAATSRTAPPRAATTTPPPAAAGTNLPALLTKR
jgi:hypothetical protein